MKTIIKSLLTAAFAATLIATPAHAGVGGSADRIRAAQASHSVDAIVAEVERAERLVCADCVDVVTQLLDHDRYEVRQVAAWWFAKRPALKTAMIATMSSELTGDSIQVRNAADFLGTVKAYDKLAALQTAFARQDLDTDAQVHLVMAVGAMGDRKGNTLLTQAFVAAAPEVRRMAVDTWRDLLGQKHATEVVALLDDDDAQVRAKAATVVGAFKEAGGRAQLEALVVNDPDPIVRRNAAYALGQIGSAESTAALTTASSDSSGLVRRVAKNALTKLR